MCSTCEWQNVGADGYPLFNLTVGEGEWRTFYFLVSFLKSIINKFSCPLSGGSGLLYF